MIEEEEEKEGELCDLRSLKVRLKGQEYRAE